MKNLLTIPSPSKSELHPLKAFLKQYPNAEYFSDALVAFDDQDNEIDRLNDLPAQIEDYLENDEIEGIEVVDRMGGHFWALQEIRDGNI